MADIGINPLDIEHIVENVIKHIEDTRTLLICRRLNKIWNKYAVEALKSQDFRVRLNDNRAMPYFELLLNANTVEVLPHLHNLHLEIRNEPVKGPGHSFISQILDNLEQLSPKLFVKSITFKGFPEGCERSVILLLRHAASQLEHVEISLISQSDTDSDQELSELFSDTHFPVLTSISSNFIFGTIVPRTLTALINRSPLLKSFQISFNTKDDLQGWHAVEGVQELLSSIEESSVLRQLQTLELPIYSPVTMEILAGIRLQQLKSLKIHTNIVLSAQHLQMLAFNSPSLSKLSILCDPRLTDQIPSRTLQMMPRIATVVEFSLHEEDGRRKSRLGFSPQVYIDAVRLARQKFRNLKSLAVDVEFLQVISNYNKSEQMGEGGRIMVNSCLRLESVTTLSVEIALCDDPVWGQPGPPTYDGIGKLVRQIMLPNLETLVINVVPARDLFDGCTVQTLIGGGKSHVKMVIKEFLSVLDGLHALEINNYYFDWISDILKEDPNLVEKVQGLKELRLNQPKVGDDYFKCFKQCWIG